MMFNKKILHLMCAGALSISGPVMANEIQWSVESGLGYESNVYHAPDHDYIDTALPSTRPTGVAVSPSEVDSFFIPVEAEVSIRNKALEDADFLAEFAFDSSLMLDSDADDATRTNVNIELGLDYDIYKWMRNKKTKKRSRRQRGEAYVGMLISTHDQVYVDRDTGLPKTTTATSTDISNKYSYQSFGIKGEYERIFGKYTFSVGYTFEDLNYETPLSGAEYDHVYNKLDLGLKREFSKATDLKARYSYFIRDYSDRHARALDGTYSSANNDLLKYTYHAIELDLGHRFSKKLKTHFEVKSTQRSDDFVGYNDYSKLDLSMRARYKVSAKTRVRAKLLSSDTDYDNAFNFEDPARGAKDSSGLDLSFKVTHKWQKHKQYYIELKHTDRESTDDRYDYTNDMLMLGAKWSY